MGVRTLLFGSVRSNRGESSPFRSFGGPALAAAALTTKKVSTNEVAAPPTTTYPVDKHTSLACVPFSRVVLLYLAAIYVPMKMGIQITEENHKKTRLDSMGP